MTTIELQKEWFTSHVRAVVNEVPGLTAEPDGDGDYPFWGETCAGWIRPIMTPPWGVGIMAIAASGVPNKVAVLREINDFNMMDPMVTAFRRADGTIQVFYRMVAEAVNPENVTGAMMQVLRAADRIGPMLATVYGGTTPKPMRPAITEG